MDNHTATEEVRCMDLTTVRPLTVRNFAQIISGPVSGLLDVRFYIDRNLSAEKPETLSATLQ